MNRVTINQSWNTKQRLKSVERDLAIDAALRRLILCHFPDLSENEIQTRADTVVESGGYTVSLDGIPLASFEIESPGVFRMMIL